LRRASVAPLRTADRLRPCVARLRRLALTGLGRLRQVSEKKMIVLLSGDFSGDGHTMAERPGKAGASARRLRVDAPRGDPP
jgi:hypothetical protein